MISLALMLVFQATAPTHCVAQFPTETYTVRLTPDADFPLMRVVNQKGVVAEGAATSYRHGTRWFLPNGPGAGFKLGVEPGRSSLCLGDGGTRCATCAPVPEKGAALTHVDTCAAYAPNTIYYVYRYQWDGWRNELRIFDNTTGHVSYGEASFSGRQEDALRLPYGPNEAYVKYLDTSIFCVGADCYPCQTESSQELTPAPELPPSLALTCRRAAPNANDVVTLRRKYDEVKLDVVFADLGVASGPAIETGPNAWYGAFDAFGLRFEVTGNTGRVCDTQAGMPERCRTCTLE